MLLVVRCKQIFLIRIVLNYIFCEVEVALRQKFLRVDPSNTLYTYFEHNSYTIRINN